MSTLRSPKWRTKSNFDAGRIRSDTILEATVPQRERRPSESSLSSKSESVAGAQASHPGTLRALHDCVTCSGIAGGRVLRLFRDTQVTQSTLVA